VSVIAAIDAKCRPAFKQKALVIMRVAVYRPHLIFQNNVGFYFVDRFRHLPLSRGVGGHALQRFVNHLFLRTFRVRDSSERAWCDSVNCR